jgi:hypothetical protein
MPSDMVGARDRINGLLSSELALYLHPDIRAELVAIEKMLYRDKPIRRGTSAHAPKREYTEEDRRRIADLAADGAPLADIAMMITGNPSDSGRISEVLRGLR